MKETLNLLPIEVSAKRVSKRGALFYPILASSVYLVIILSLWLLNITRHSTIQKEIKTLSIQKADLQARAAALSKPVADTKPSAEKEIFQQINSARKWSRVISEISLIVPEEVWLSSIEARQEHETIGCKGYALNQMAVASFISALENSAIFEDVEIVYSQKGEKEVSFELKAKLKWV